MNILLYYLCTYNGPLSQNHDVSEGIPNLDNLGIQCHYGALQVLIYNMHVVINPPELARFTSSLVRGSYTIWL